MRAEHSRQVSQKDCGVLSAKVTQSPAVRHVPSDAEPGDRVWP